MDFNVVNWGLISMCQKSVFCSCELHIGIRINSICKASTRSLCTMKQYTYTVHPTMLCLYVYILTE